MTLRATLTLHFHSYWCCSTGGAGSDLADMPAYRDRDGCPALPMTMVRGQLRETAIQIFGPAITPDLLKLFGAPSQKNPEEKDRAPGLLRFVGEARMAKDDRDFFCAHPPARAQLFKRLMSTRINDRGVAADKTLRSIEACVPLKLTGEVHLDPLADKALQGAWITHLDHLCAATMAMGKQKTNGFGRVVARCEGMS
jgi:hypothetical protein